MFMGKVAVITGGAHGIGRAIADALFVKAQLSMSLTSSLVTGLLAMYRIKKHWNGLLNQLFRKAVIWII